MLWVCSEAVTHSALCLSTPQLFPVGHSRGRLNVSDPQKGALTGTIRDASLEKWEVARWISERRRRNHLGSGPSLFTIPSLEPILRRCLAPARSVVRLKWKHSQVSKGIIISRSRQHHQYNCMSDLSVSDQGSCTGKLSGTNLPVCDPTARIRTQHKGNTGHHITWAVVVVISLWKEKPRASVFF